MCIRDSYYAIHNLSVTMSTIRLVCHLHHSTLCIRICLFCPLHFHLPFSSASTLIVYSVVSLPVSLIFFCIIIVFAFYFPILIVILLVFFYVLRRFLLSIYSSLLVFLFISLVVILTLCLIISVLHLPISSLFTLFLILYESVPRVHLDCCCTCLLYTSRCV